MIPFFIHCSGRRINKRYSLAASALTFMQQRQNKSVTLHISLIVLNIVLLLIHQFIAFFWEYDSICLITGFSVGGVICGLIDRKIDSK